MSLRNTIGSADFETTDFAFPQDAVAGLCADAEYFAHLLNLSASAKQHSFRRQDLPQGSERPPEIYNSRVVRLLATMQMPGIMILPFFL